MFTKKSNPSHNDKKNKEDITKYGTVGWVGYVPPAKPAVNNVSMNLQNLEKSGPYSTKSKATTVEYKENCVVLHFPEEDESTESFSL